MSDRPLIQFSADELEQRATSHWEALDHLKQIRDELNHRSTPKALRLERRVFERLQVLQGAAAGGGGSQQSEDVRKLRETLLSAQQVLRQREQELHDVRSQLDALRGKSGNGRSKDYVAVGLDPTCPEFVLRAVRPEHG